MVATELCATALVIPVSEANEAVGKFREEHDWSAQHGMPPHVTVLLPFREISQLGASDFRMLEDLFGSRDPISFELKNSQRFNRYVYLRPEPSEPFITLTNEVLTAYPDLKPYGGRFGYDGVIPHLTVAYHHNDAVLDQISGQLEGTRIITVASVVHLMECRNDGWCSIAEFRLGK
jgi:hypothetical protein